MHAEIFEYEVIDNDLARSRALRSSASDEVSNYPPKVSSHELQRSTSKFMVKSGLFRVCFSNHRLADHRKFIRKSGKRDENGLLSLQ